MRTEEQAGAEAQSKTEKINEHRRIGKQRNNRNQKKTEKQKEETIKCTLCQGHYDFSFSDFYFIFVCCVEASK